MMSSGAINELVYTEAAQAHVVEIGRYLLNRFTRKELEAFLQLLKEFEATVCLYPTMFRIALKSKKVRRAVLSKECSVLYQVISRKITILAVCDNRCDLSRFT